MSYEETRSKRENEFVSPHSTGAEDTTLSKGDKGTKKNRKDFLLDQVGKLKGKLVTITLKNDYSVTGYLTGYNRDYASLVDPASFQPHTIFIDWIALIIPEKSNRSSRPVSLSDWEKNGNWPPWESREAGIEEILKTKKVFSSFSEIKSTLKENEIFPVDFIWTRDSPPKLEVKIKGRYIELATKERECMEGIAALSWEGCRTNPFSWWRFNVDLLPDVSKQGR